MGDKMSALDNLIYGLQNFRLFVQDDVELYSGSIKVSLQIEAVHELEKLRKDLELSQQHLKECDSELSYECHQSMKLRSDLEEARKVIELADKLLDESMHDSYYSTCAEYNEQNAIIDNWLASHPREPK
jgi:hypothetical protein